MEFLLLLIVALAIERAGEIMSELDFLQPCRDLWGRTFPRISKLAYCKFCQCFWASGVMGIWVPLDSLQIASCFWVKWGVVWLATWGLALLWGGLMEILVDNTPRNMFVQYRQYEDPKDE